MTKVKSFAFAKEKVEVDGEAEVNKWTAAVEAHGGAILQIATMFSGGWYHCYLWILYKE